MVFVDNETKLVLGLCAAPTESRLNPGARPEKLSFQEKMDRLVAKWLRERSDFSNNLYELEARLGAAVVARLGRRSKLRACLTLFTVTPTSQE